MTAVLQMPATAVPAESGKLKFVKAFALMFLPVIAYQIGEYLTAHWEPARQLEHALAPYAFSTSLFVGLVVGMGQFVWKYGKTRQLSAYVLQQMAWLLAYTFIPLYFGHYVHQTAADPIGYNVIGFVGLGLAAVYLVDFCLGANLMMAFPKHFSPETAQLSHHPNFRRVVGHIELAMIAMFALKGTFLVFGIRLLPKATYLLVLPFFVKGLLFAFIAFAIGYPQWVRRRVKAAKAAEAPVAEPVAG